MTESYLDIPVMSNIECYHYISSLTHNFRNIPAPKYRDRNKLIILSKKEYIPYIQNSILSTPLIYYGRLYVNSEKDIISKLIGNKCFRLYLMSKKFNLILIWYNNKTKEFVFYGSDMNNIAMAVMFMYDKICKYQ
jgi:hypothetical protein